jgi:hypothetical protein
VEQVGGRSNPLAVPLVVMLGVPLYANAAGTIPIVEALLGKGLPLGTVLAFMMAVTALSIPELLILRRVMRRELLACSSRLLPGILAVVTCSTRWSREGVRDGQISPGFGCANCIRLEQAAGRRSRWPVCRPRWSGHDYGQIMARGVIARRAGHRRQGVSVGRVPSAGDIAEWLARSWPGLCGRWAPAIPRPRIGRIAASGRSTGA